MTRVFVIILNWNRKEDTIETIRSASQSNLGAFSMEIVVVDNSSTDGSVKEISKVLKKIDGEIITTKLIKNNENLGFCEGNNVGIRYALESGADYIVLLNDDTIVGKDLVKNLLKTMIDNPKAGAVSPKIYFAPGYEFHKDRYKKTSEGKVVWYAGGDIDWKNVYGSNHGVDEVDKGQFDKLGETDFATGCCVIFPREVIEDVGLLDRRYFAYLEDMDISQRIKAAGYKVLYDPSGIVWHKVSQSSGIGSELNDYFITRNRMLFGIKYAPLRAKLALLKESLRLLKRGRKWQKKGIEDFYKLNFGRGSWQSAEDSSGSKENE